MEQVLKVLLIQGTDCIRKVEEVVASFVRELRSVDKPESRCTIYLKAKAEAKERNILCLQSIRGVVYEIHVTIWFFTPTLNKHLSKAAPSL